MGYLENVTPNQLLSSIGLTRTNAPTTAADMVMPIALFGMGLLVGAGLALFLTPKTGQELRSDLSRQANKLGNAVRERIPALPKRGADEQAWENSSSLP